MEMIRMILIEREGKKLTVTTDKEKARVEIAKGEDFALILVSDNPKSEGWFRFHNTLRMVRAFLKVDIVSFVMGESK